jgi:integrase
MPSRRVRLKTPSARRQIPISPQLATLLQEHRETSTCNAVRDWVFATRNGTPFNQRNVQRSTLSRAACAARLDQDGTRLRFHDLRHTFASHMIIDLNLDVVQVRRILGHASPATTLEIYAHLFDEARHAAEIRARMSRSAFARMLDPITDPNVITLPSAARTPSHPLSARERAAIRWAT